MSDNLRTRIAAVLSEHVEDQLTNYDAERNECGCGHQGDATYRDHLADAVIRELGWQRIVDYCTEQAAIGWRDVGTADEAMGRNIVAEVVLTILEGTDDE